jgi:PAS domain S-box-containing protein
MIEKAVTVTVEHPVHLLRLMLATSWPEAIRLLPERLFASARERKFRKFSLTQAETELVLSRQQLALHVERTPLAVVEFDIGGRVTAWNPSAATMFGYSSEEAVGQHWTFIVPKSVSGTVDGVWESLVTQQGGSRSTNENTTKDGRTLSCEWFNTPLVDANGEVIGVVSLVLDTTAQRRAEEALCESEERFRTIVELAPDAIFIVDEGVRLLEVNSAACRQLGLAREQLLQRSVLDIVPSRFRDQFAQSVQAPDGFFESCLLRADGTEIPVEVSIRGVVLGGQPAALWIARDITERKRAEADLRHLGEIVESSDDAIIGKTPEGIITSWNSGAEHVYGYTKDEVLGRSIAMLIPPEHQEELTRILDRVKRGERVRHFEAERVRKDGGRAILSLTISPIKDVSGRIVGASTIGRDITERKRAEEEKTKLQHQLAQAQKMESIGRLAGGVAHDFNNLLTVINGYSKLLLRDLKEGDPLRDSLEEISKAGERAAGLTRQLLAFSRKQILEPRRLDINGVVTDLRPMLERLVGEDIEVRIALHAEGGTVYADPHQLEQVVMNLVVNARDAMPGVGKLLVETACVERDESYARSHPEARAGRFVMLAVTDTGVGMDEETKNRIFEPFFTTKEAGKGTGLGLSMVQGVVAQSGGYVEVYSEKCRGTTFKIYLPALTEAAVDAARSAPVPVLGGKETVLVVEDQANVRKFADAVLKAYGYRVIPVENASEALVACQRVRFDLVLTDVVMPHVSGRDLADKLELLQPDIKVLFMSGYTDDVIAHFDVLAGGAKFIQKPFSPEELAGKVREVLGPPTLAARILVVDDEAGVRSFLRKALEDGGYEVIEAADGRQALQQAAEGHVDLVVTDLVMPEQEGIETIQALRKDGPGIRIIAMSGAFGGQFLKAAQVLGADAVLAKPVNAELLLAKVAEVLKTRR